MDKKRMIITAAGALLFGAIVWTVATVPPERTQEEHQGAAKKQMEYQKNVLKEEDKGRLVWEITSDTSSVDVKTQDTTMTNIIGHYYREDGVTLTLTAPHGVYNSKKQSVKLTGGAKAVTNDGGTVTSDSLAWSAPEELLIAEGKAVFIYTKDKLDVRGDRIEVRENFGRFKVNGNAKVKKGK